MTTRPFQNGNGLWITARFDVARGRAGGNLSAMNSASGTNKQKYQMGMRPSRTACSTGRFCGLSKSSPNTFMVLPGISIRIDLLRSDSAPSVNTFPRLQIAKETGKYRIV